MAVPNCIRKMLIAALMLANLPIALAAADSNGATTAMLDEVIGAPHRSDENRARDRYRHPKETLMFFGLRPDMTVVEISPAAGWYTEIIAPILSKQGKYYGAVPALGAEAPEAMKRRDLAYREMLRGDKSLYSTASVITFDPARPVFAPAGTADLVVTFRNVHNWAKAGNAEAMFRGFFEALKPGGVLGVVEHRARPGTSLEKQVASGYMTEDYVIDQAQRAGFRLVARSDVNNNPRDTTDHPGGVWNLPPNLRGVPEQDKPRYLAIGESDRMTLKFLKP